MLEDVLLYAFIAATVLTVWHWYRVLVRRDRERQATAEALEKLRLATRAVQLRRWRRRCGRRRGEGADDA